MRSNRLIQFYLTNQCNSHCRTCSIWKNKPEDKLELPYQKVEDVIERFPKADYVFGGGEVTMYSELPQLQNFCDSYDIQYTCLTNCIDYMAAENMVVKRKAPNVTISCDGINHDMIRGTRGNLNNIKTFVRNCRDLTNLKLSYTYSRWNEESFDEDMAFFKGMGFDKIYFCLAQDMDLLNSNSTVRAEDFRKILKHKDMLYDKDVLFIERMVSNSKVDCDSTKSVYTIYTNGDVVMCQSYMSSYTHGNIFDTPFHEIIKTWEGDGKCPECMYDGKCNLLCQRRYD